MKNNFESIERSQERSSLAIANEDIISKMVSNKTPELLLWNKLKAELKGLGDNNYKARIIYDYVMRNFKG